MVSLRRDEGQIHQRGGHTEGGGVGGAGRGRDKRVRRRAAI